MRISEALSSFLKAESEGKPNADLISRYLEHCPQLETQVNVGANGGEPVSGKRATYSNGLLEWFNFRIPRGAASEPTFNDWELRWPLEHYAEAIGSTGWDWYGQVSRWVGFDFDSITNHAEGVGLKPENLQEIANAVSSLPYVETRTSTSGEGLHLYVHLNVPTKTHTEHAALAQAVLGIMSRDAKFDFYSQVDAMGAILWFWHRGRAQSGLSLVKAAQHPLTDIPSNWRDYIEVVTRKRTKVKLKGVEDEDEFERIARAYPFTPLDAEHRRIINELSESGYSAVWVQDYHLLQTHTKALEELHNKKGIFVTNSNATDPATPNCFCFPLPNGAFKVYRFSKGIQEHPTWTHDEWTHCVFNEDATFKVAALACDGVEVTKNGFQFETVTKALKCLKVLDLSLNLKASDEFLLRSATIFPVKDTLVLEIEKRKTDPAVPGLAAQKGKWVRVFRLAASEVKPVLVPEFDSTLRCLLTPKGDASGWALLCNNEWTRQPVSNVKMALQALGNSRTDAEVLMGHATLKPWKMVCLPFQPEYPGNRQWNQHAPQWSAQPADEPGPHPYWDTILDHIGNDLNTALATSEWAKKNNIFVGADYLRLWIATVLRKPYDRLPYLFLWGPENSGKSILHEAFSLLVTGGVVKADRALTSQSDFNAELEGSILNIVEEKDVARIPGALQKIKEAVTALELMIRRMRMDPYSAPNLTHWIQCNQKRDAAPIFIGDTRVTMIHVPKPEADIPKDELLARLKEEVPNLLRTCIDLPLPQPEGRLRLKVISTDEKLQVESFNSSSLEQFIHEQCYHIPGAAIEYGEFYDRLQEFLSPEEKYTWTFHTIKKHLPHGVVTGRHKGNKTYIGNLSFEENPPREPAAWTVHKGRLRCVSECVSQSTDL